MAAANKAKPRIGVFGIGLATYWSQFDGLKEALAGYQRDIENRVSALGADVISAGMVDTAQRASEAGALFAREQVDLIICYVGTYATSSQVVPVAQKGKAPVLVLNLQPGPRMDYPNTDTAKWLEYCCACCVPEIANAFERTGVEFHVVTGLIYPAEGNAAKYHERAWSGIAAHLRAAGAAAALRASRFGFLGHVYPGMLDMYTDFTQHAAQFQSHIEILEMEDLHARMEDLSDDAIAEKIAEISTVFEFAEPGIDRISKPVTPEALQWSAKVAVGLDRLTEDFELDALTYYYRGLDENIFEQIWAGLIVGNSLLTARGVPAAGEGDLKTNVAMFILDRLGAGGSFTEIYGMDFVEDFVLMGHDGPGHIAISDKKPLLRGLGLFHGKRGYGLSVEFNVKTGPVTLLACTQRRDGRYRFVIAEGEAIAGQRLEIGNTNSRLKFALEPDEFINRWCAQAPTHHCALGVGHKAEEIRRTASFLGVETVTI